MTKKHGKTKEELMKQIRRFPVKIVRKPASPLMNDFDRQVMANCERIRKKKGIHPNDVLPMFDNRYYSLLCEIRRKIYAKQLFLLAEGLDCKISDLTEGINGDKPFSKPK